MLRTFHLFLQKKTITAPDKVSLSSKKRHLVPLRRFQFLQKKKKKIKKFKMFQLQKNPTTAPSKLSHLSKKIHLGPFLMVHVLQKKKKTVEAIEKVSLSSKIELVEPLKRFYPFLQEKIIGAPEKVSLFSKKDSWGL